MGPSIAREKRLSGSFGKGKPMIMHETSLDGRFDVLQKIYFASKRPSLEIVSLFIIFVELIKRQSFKRL